MAKKHNQTKMPLTSVVQEFMEFEGWQDQVEIDEDQISSRVQTTYSIKNQKHLLFLECNEEAKWFKLFMYGPVNVPPNRMDATTRLLNRVNFNLGLGRFGVADDDDANPIQYFASIDVNGGLLAPVQVSTLVEIAVEAFEHYGDLFAAAAMTKQSVSDLWATFLDESSENEDSPDES